MLLGKPIMTLLILMTGSGSVYALDAEKLFMPGELILGHMEYELDCKQCHVRLRDTTQNQLCMDCHEPIAVDVKGEKGFHGKNPLVVSSECKTCHADHKGRDAKIIWLDKERLDHRQTDFPLQGRHQAVDCSACHKSNQKYREADSKCITCHRDDDIHENRLGKECDNCHNPGGWSSEQFDHDKTDFPLRHGHKKVACDLCHVEKSYKDTPTECVRCHAIKDVHGQRFGSQCQDCHVEKKWSVTVFNHDRDTRFELRGRHRPVSCHACHSPSGKTTRDGGKKTRSCFQCHRLDDVHKGNNGKKCESCHGEKSWLESRFDHDERTDFPLKGAHREARCQACHADDGDRAKTDTACYGCHKNKDAHRGQEGKQCEQCHNQSTWWLRDVRYDHDLSEFPLIGQHAVAGCEACHLTSAFKDAAIACNHCHEKDDIHRKSLGDACQRCHNPNDWLIWEFDHDQTDFMIDGSHEDLHCNRCHYRPLVTDDSRDSLCIDCHYQDDIHNNNFGDDCRLCHSTVDFSKATVNTIWQPD